MENKDLRVFVFCILGILSWVRSFSGVVGVRWVGDLWEFVVKNVGVFVMYMVFMYINRVIMFDRMDYGLL